MGIPIAKESPSTEGRAPERRTQGATLVEFALVAPLILTIIAFILDSFYIAHMYSRLTFETAELTRYVASVTGRGSRTRSCPELQTLAAQAIDVFRSHAPLSTGMSFSSTVQGGDLLGVPGYRVLSIRGSWILQCSICRFFAEGKELTNESTLIVESSTPGCP